MIRRAFHFCFQDCSFCHQPLINFFHEEVCRSLLLTRLGRTSPMIPRALHALFDPIYDPYRRRQAFRFFTRTYHRRLVPFFHWSSSFFHQVTLSPLLRPYVFFFFFLPSSLHFNRNACLFFTDDPHRHGCTVQIALDRVPCRRPMTAIWKVMYETQVTGRKDMGERGFFVHVAGTQ